MLFKINADKSDLESEPEDTTSVTEQDILNVGYLDGSICDDHDKTFDEEPDSLPTINDGNTIFHETFGKKMSQMLKS